MNFADLYRFADQQTSPSVSVMELTRHVIERHMLVGTVQYHAVELNEDISLGHMVLEMDRTSAYEEEYANASIRFSNKLNRCWRRLVCCKELMHVFDGRTERVNTRERFITLMGELESKPLSADVSDMYGSEREAMWMAFLVLCPLRLRSELLPQYLAKEASKEEIADRLKIPVGAINAVFGDYYPVALERLTGDPSGAIKAKKAAPIPLRQAKA